MENRRRMKGKGDRKGEGGGKRGGRREKEGRGLEGLKGL